jgi:hypothetical protein
MNAEQMTKELGGTLTIHYQNPKTGIDCQIVIYADPGRENLVKAVLMLEHLEGQIVALHQPLENQ